MIVLQEKSKIKKEKAPEVKGSNAAEGRGTTPERSLRSAASANVRKLRSMKSK